MNRNNILQSLMLLIIITLFSCEVEVPIKEIIDAKLAIDRAIEVKAEKYSEKNLKNAIQFLYDSHALIKDDKIGDAKGSAEKSKQAANLSIKVSLPLLAKDTLNEATKIYSDADLLNAQAFASDEFKKTDETIKESDKLNKETKYWESYLKSKEAIASGKTAIEKSLSTIPNFQSKLNQLQSEYEGLKSNELSKTSETEINKAKVDIDKAKAELDEKKLKNISKYLENIEKNLKVAKGNIDDAVNNEKRIIEGKEKINQLTKEIEALKNSRGKDFALDDINKAETSLGEANELLAKKKPNEVVTVLASVENSLKSAQLKTKKGLAKEKLGSVVALYEQIKIKDTDNKFKENLEKANTTILNSNKSFDDNLYDESIGRSEEAEAILNSISVALGKTDEEKKIVVKDGDKDIDKDKDKVEILIEQKSTYYVVKYRKKDTDCLWRIAMNVYKDAKLWPIIYKANRDQIKDPDLIFPGQKFMIPSIEKRKNIVKEVDEIKSELKDKKDSKKPEKIKK